MKEQSLNPSDIAVKSLNLTHIEEIKRLMLDIFSGEPWNDHWSGDQLHAYITQLTGNANSLAYGLYVDGQLAGIALGRIINWYEGTEYWIDEFGIHPCLQQAGMGSKFMTEIVNRVAGQGISYIVLLTERHVPAYDFYLKNGFVENEGNVCFVKKVL